GAQRLLSWRDRSQGSLSQGRACMTKELVKMKRGAAMSESGRGYLALRDYSVIGGGNTAALVANDGSMDWLCLPSFDNDPIFVRLLDAERGGFFDLIDVTTGQNPAAVGQRYVDDTAILETEVAFSAGRVVVTDLLPVPPTEGAPPALLRQLRVTRGFATVRLRIKVSEAYGQSAAPMTPSAAGAMFTGRAGTLLL